MAGFVKEILSSAGNLDIDDLNAKMSKLSEKSVSLKVELMENIQRKHGDFLPALDAAIFLERKVEDLKMDMEILSTNIESQIKSTLNVSTNEFSELKNQLAETSAILAILEKLVALNQCSDLFDASIQDSALAAKQLSKAKEILAKTVNDRESEIKVMQLFTQKHERDVVEFSRRSYDQLGEYIRWKCEDNKSQRSNSCSLVAFSNKQHHTLCSSLHQGLHHLNLLSREMEMFSNKLLKNFLLPVMTSSTAVVTTSLSEDGQKERIDIVFNTLDKSPPEPTDAYKKLAAIILFFCKHLLDITVTDEEHKISLAEFTGDVIGQTLADELITRVLKHSIPGDKAELEKYQTVVQATLAAETQLQKKGILKEENQTLSNYVNNVNSLFAEKKNTELLTKVRNMLTQQVHNTVRVPREGEPGFASANQNLENGNIESEAEDKELSRNCLRFPECHISDYVDDFVKLLYATMEEATKCQAFLAVQLFYSVRSCLELFCTIPVEFNRENLKVLPQFAAIHHNNCMYVAHHLLTLGCMFKARLPEPLSVGPVTFVDLIPRIRRIGTDGFLQHMTIQKNNLQEIIKEADNFQNAAAEGLTLERCLNQCQMLLEKLAPAWAAVLPRDVCAKAVGALANVVLHEFVSGVTSLDDISADDAIQLESFAALLLTKIPTIFTHLETPAQSPMAMAHSNVSSFGRLQELRHVLGASLAEIADRWTDGQGPLAAVFGADDVKQMIRALFQNTDRRAAVLAKIK